VRTSNSNTHVFAVTEISIFEVVTVMIDKIVVLCDTMYSYMLNRLFGGTWCLHFHRVGRRIFSHRQVEERWSLRTIEKARVYVTTFLLSCPFKRAHSLYRLYPWRWRQIFPPKHRYPPIRVWCVTNKNATLWKRYKIADRLLKQRHANSNLIFLGQLNFKTVLY
jgi:hypothetical protein